MGAHSCCASEAVAKAVSTIPDPTGEPEDPLISKK